MHENKRTPIIAPNQDQPVRCIVATTPSGSDKSPKTANNRPIVEPSSPVIKAKIAPSLLGLRGGAGCGAVAGRGVGGEPIGVGKLGPRGAGVGRGTGVGRGAGAGPGAVGEFAPCGDGVGCGLAGP